MAKIFGKVTCSDGTPRLYTILEGVCDGRQCVSSVYGGVDVARL